MGNFLWLGTQVSSSCAPDLTFESCAAECRALRQGEGEGACEGFTFRPKDG